MNTNKLYSISFVFPIWMYFILPMHWLKSVPALFVWVSIVLIIMYAVMKKPVMSMYGSTVLKSFAATFEAWFFSATPLFIIMLINSSQWFIDNIQTPVGYDPFSNAYGFFITLAAVVFGGVLIYFANYIFVFKKRTDMEHKEKIKAALTMAIACAPYVYFIPLNYLYTI